MSATDFEIETLLSQKTIHFLCQNSTQIKEGDLEFILSIVNPKIIYLK